jgi:hypothetical protein
MKIANALGVRLLDIDSAPSVQQFREQQAMKKAKRIVAMSQATSALEAQGATGAILGDFVSDTTHRLLAGSSRTLWSE